MYKKLIMALLIAVLSCLSLWLYLCCFNTNKNALLFEDKDLARSILVAGHYEITDSDCELNTEGKEVVADFLTNYLALPG